jgi:hypothetical protein
LDEFSMIVSTTALSRTVLTTFAYLIAMSAAHSTEFSVRGVRLGMSIANVTTALSADLAASARLEQKIISDVIIGDLEELMTVSAGSHCGWTEYDRNEACVNFSALAADGGMPLKDDGVLLIRLLQFFAYPISLEAFERRIIEEYGQPALNWMTPALRPPFQILPTSHTHRRWLWSDDSWAKSQEARDWLGATFMTDWDDSKFEQPYLLINAYLRDGMVRGMAVGLFDTKRLRERSERSSAARLVKESERAKRSKEAADQIQLR